MARQSNQARLYEHILKEIPMLDDDSLMALSALSRQLVIARGQAKAKLLNLNSPVKIAEEVLKTGSANFEVPSRGILEPVKKEEPKEDKDA